MGLAFIAAMQVLPPRQRAVLVLRDALGWRAAEVASLLDDSVASVNSALQRARAAIVRQQEAWARVDIEAIVGLLSDDALLTMPPDQVRVEGAEAIGRFFATAPAGGRLDRIALVPVRANGQPALACYADEEGEGEHRAYGVMVLALDGERVAGITGFPRDASLFERFGLPVIL